jgi:hypothetical protein
MTDQMIAVVDTETTSLTRETMLPWEITVIRRPLYLESQNHRIVRTYMIDEPDLTDADSESLRIGGFYERHPLGEIGHFDQGGYFGSEPPPNVRWRAPRHEGELWTIRDERVIARDVEWMIRGAHLVAAQPGFDERALTNLLQRNQLAPAHLHRSYDVESLVAGSLGLPIVGLVESAQAIGIDTSGYEAHTSRGDALLAERIFDDVMGIR